MCFTLGKNPEPTFVKTIIIKDLLLFLAVCQVAHAAVIAGSFDWSSSSGVPSGTASFSYDTSTGTGNVLGLHPGSGSWVSPGNWSFTLQVAGVNLYSSKVLISDFTDLTIFSNREILIMPPTSLENPAVPYTIIGEIQWHLRQGPAYGVLDEEWFTSDQALPSPTFGTGSTGNFVETAPEPTAAMCFVLSGVLLSMRRSRHEKQRAQQAAT